MTVPIKITYTGDIFAGKVFAKQARVQVGMLKDDMKYLGLQQGRRFVTISPGVTIETRSVFGFDEARVHVTPPAGKLIRKRLAPEEIFKWYWYAFAVSLDDTGVFIPTGGGGGMSDIDLDGSNNVYVVGYSRTKNYLNVDMELSNESIHIKYDNDGKFLLRRVLEGGEYANIDRNESGTGVAIDITVPNPLDPLNPIEIPHGGVYVLSDFFFYRDDYCYDCSLFKYSSSGTVKWKKRLSLGENGINDIFSWGVDSDLVGNAVVTGHANIYNGDTFHSPWDAYALMYSKGMLVSFAYDGEVNWAAQIGDPLPDENGYPTTKNSVHLYAIDVAPAGDIVVCGSIHENTVGAAIPAGLIVKLNNLGEVQWKRAIEGFLHKRDDTLALYGDANTGLNATGCGIDTDGSVYVISLVPCDVATNSGFYHYHLTKINSIGELQWQRFFEVEYFSDADARLYAFTAQLAVGSDGVYVICPRFPNTATSTLWGSHILKFDKTGGMLWQRLVEVELSAPFISYSGIVLRAIKARGGDIYLAGQIVSNASPITMKLPGAGPPIGKQKGLFFSNPGLTIYTDDATIPIHEDAGTGDITPAYEISFLSSFTLNVNSGFVTISTPTEGDYFSPLWTQTNKIIKSTVTKENN